MSRILGRYSDKVVPYMGLDINTTPIIHFLRDFLFAYLLWQLGYRDFQLAFTTMLISGFLETGQGTSLRPDGSQNFFDVLDFLPSVFAGFLVVSYLSNTFDLILLLTLVLLYFAVLLVLFVLNKMLSRKFIFRR
ncbi:MAG: hypothetical protein ACE5HS_01435 [bacterium]